MRTLDLHSIAIALGGEVSGGQVRAPGPGHSAADRSLSVKLDSNAPDGFVVHSFANDDPITCRDYVLSKTGQPTFRPNGNGRSAPVVELKTRRRFSDSALRQKGYQLKEAYPYEDKDGVLLYDVLRYEHPTLEKTFLQRSPDDKGGWLSDAGETKVLYRWPELLKYPEATVFVCEGEKNSERVASLEHCATTVASGSWKGVDISALAGRDIIILEDADETGVKKALAAANALQPVAKTIRIVRLPGHEQTTKDHGKDVSDWLDEDPSRADQLVDVCFAAPLWAPEAHNGEEANPVPLCGAQVNARIKAKEARGRDNSPAVPLPLKWDRDIDDAEAKQEWLVKKMFFRVGSALLSGQWGAYKTFLALDLAYAVMAKRSKFAGRLIKRHGGVLFIAAEGESQIKIRLKAMKEDDGRDEPLPIAWCADCPKLTDKENALAILIATVKQMAEQLKNDYGVELVLIVIDTMIRASGYRDENDAAEVQTVMSLLDELARATETLVLGVDHFGKDKDTGTRGSSDKESSVDNVIAALAERSIGGKLSGPRIAIRKCRGAEVGAEIPFAVKPVDLGVDEDGEPINSLVIVWGAERDATPATKAGSRLSAGLTLLVRSFEAMLADCGEDLRPFPNGPVVRAVDREAVRGEFYRTYSGADGDKKKQANAKRQQFNRLIMDAQAKGLLVVREIGDRTMMWPVGNDAGRRAA
jgi:hypothetical protein